MKSELIISIYLFFFKIAFSLFNLLPLKNKTVFLSSFGDNAFFIANELASSSSHRLVFVNQTRCKMDFSTIPTANKKIYTFESLNIVDTLFSIYHLATSKYVFVDNYAGVLSVIEFRKEVKCIQLWHAAGAIKQFGWRDPETDARSSRAKVRFQEVYDRFQYIPVGSRQMAEIFSEAFQVDMSHFLYTGVPQTDFYFDEELKAAGLKNVLDAYPSLKGKKVVLYAPTFRKDELQRMTLAFDIQLFLETLGEEYVLLVRLHPSVHAAAEVPDHPRVILASDYPHINELLLVSDILVSDYSSIPVEFSMLGKKMIFFTYDIEEYNRKQGIWQVNELFFPGPMVTSTADVLQHIVDPEIDVEKIGRFSAHWNTFSNGRSSKQLITAIYNPEDL
ncbi:CDP-glycerol glycerophosphotransferase family protein [Planococcus sp. MERTA32b]|nr:CDP-glycerol glycerophosphotransferase family protein [Planococcus sp. MER TA 32b]